MSKYPVGIWMPTAKVICFECHGPEFHRSFGASKILSNEEFQNEIAAKPLHEGNGVTFCDVCKRAIQMDESIAWEHNFVAEVRNMGFDAFMEQTGGMNDAMSIRCIEDDKYYMVTYNFDGTGEYWIQKMNYEHGDALDSFFTKDEEEFREYFSCITDLKPIDPYEKIKQLLIEFNDAAVALNKEWDNILDAVPGTEFLCTEYPFQDGFGDVVSSINNWTSIHTKGDAHAKKD